MVDLLVIEVTRTTGATFQLKNGAGCSVNSRARGEHEFRNVEGAIGLAAFVRPMSDTRPKSNSIMRYRNYQYASDPVTFFEYRSLYCEPDLMLLAQTCRLPRSV